MKELTFLVREAEEGGYCAEVENVGIFAEGDDLDQLTENIISGIDCYYNEKSGAEIPAPDFKMIFL